MEQKRLLTKNQASDYLGVSRQTIENWLEGGVITGRYINNILYIDSNSLDALLDDLAHLETLKDKLKRTILQVEEDITEQNKLHDDHVKAIKAFSNYSTKAINAVNAKAEFFINFVRSICKLDNFPDKTISVFNWLIYGYSPYEVSKIVEIPENEVKDIVKKFWVTTFRHNILEKLLKENTILKKQLKDKDEEIYFLKKCLSSQLPIVDQNSRQSKGDIPTNEKLTDSCLSKRTINALTRIGIFTSSDLLSININEANHIKGLGEKGLMEIRNYIGNIKKNV